MNRLAFYISLMFLAVLAILLPCIALALGERGWAGDVAGRDLSISGIGTFGHLAIETGRKNCDEPNGKCEYLVLQVMPRPDVIYKDTIGSFTARARVWRPNPERYYARCARCSHDWHSVVRAGWEQRNWSPQFSLSAEYTEGKMVRKRIWDPGKQKYVDKWIRQNAKFRCDNFVVYSYRKGLGVNLSPAFLTSRTVWKLLPFNYSWDRKQARRLRRSKPT